MTDNNEKCSPVKQEQLDKVYRDISDKYKLDLEKLKLKFNTQEQLNALISELLCDPKTNQKVDEIIYQRYIEETIKREGIKSISLDNISSNIDSKTLENIKLKFNEIIDTLLLKYTFIPKEQKNIFKLAIFNKLLSNNGDKINDLANLLENISKNDLTTIDKIQITGESGNILSMKKIFQETISPYISKFDEIISLENFKNLQEQEKQNIIKNNNWFNNPILIEKGFEGLNLNHLKTSNDFKLSTQEITQISQYMLNSRINLEKFKDSFTKIDSTITIPAETGSKESSQEGIGGILGFLFKLFPDLKEIFEGLGIKLDGGNNQIDKTSTEFKIFSGLKSIFKQENGEGDKDSIFKNKIIEGDENDYKNELKSLKEIYPGNTDFKELFLKGFSKDGHEVNKIKIKFEISEEELKKDTISKDVLKKSINDGVNKYKKEKTKQIQQEQQSNAGELNNLSQRLQTKINGETNFSLNNGLDLGNGENIKFTPDNQRIIIGKYSYSIKVTNPLASNIEVSSIDGKGDNVKIVAIANTAFGEIKKDEESSKLDFLAGLQEVITKGEFNKTSGDTSLNITRIS